MSWNDDLAMNDSLVARYFDISACTMKPRTGGAGVNHARSDDVSRDAFDFAGSIDDQPSGDLLARHRPGDPSSGRSNPYFDAVLTALVTNWPWLPRTHDHVVCGDTTWIVMAEASDGTARRAWYLNRN